MLFAQFGPLWVFALANIGRIIITKTDSTNTTTKTSTSVRAKHCFWRQRIVTFRNCARRRRLSIPNWTANHAKYAKIAFSFRVVRVFRG